MDLLKYIVIFTLANTIESARILCVFPLSGKSHYVTFETLALELANRGHELVIISHFPQKKPVPGIIDIDTTKYLPTYVSSIEVEKISSIPSGTMYDLVDLYGLIEETSAVFNVPKVLDLVNSTKDRFDLIINEMFHTDMFMGFAKTFNVPVVGFSSSTMMPWMNSRFANPDNPAYIQCLSSQYIDKMTFFQRFHNALQTWASNFAYVYFYDRRSEYYARKYFGNDLPPLKELAKNSSLLLFNSHHSFYGARPLVPNVVEIGGIHIRPVEKLPKEENYKYIDK